MAKWIITFSVFLVVVVWGFYHTGVIVEDTYESQIPKWHWQNRPVPTVTFTQLDNSQLSFEKLKGKIILLNFWASWCGPCLQEFPSLMKLAREFGDDLALVAISNDSSTEDIKKFLNKFEKDYGAVLQGPNVHVVWDKEMVISQEKFNIIRVPETIIVDKNLNMVRKIVGAIEWDGTEMRQYLSQLR